MNNIPGICTKCLKDLVIFQRVLGNNVTFNIQGVVHSFPGLYVHIAICT